MRLNIDDWKEYSTENTGVQEKVWLIKDGTLYMFKEASKRLNSNKYVLNDISECVASDVGALIDIDCAKYTLCERNGSKGVVTPNFLNNKAYKVKKEELISGSNLLSRADPGFKPRSLENPKTGDLYTLSLLLKCVEEYGLIKEILEMVVFDLLIGNHDRNASNWGIIKNLETNKVRFSPLYDNGASLGIPLDSKTINKHIIEVDGSAMIINDIVFSEVIHNHIISKVVLERYFQKEGKIRWDNSRREKELPYKPYNYRIMEYKPIFEYITTFYPDEISCIINSIEDNVNENSIDIIFNKYCDELDISRIKFSKTILLERSRWMVEHYNKEIKKTWGRC